MDADGSLWLPCCNFIMYLQCISVGLSIKAVHLDKEVRFLLFGPSGSDPGTSEFDLTWLVLSAGIATEYFSVLWMREFFMSLYFTLFCYFCFFYSQWTLPILPSGETEGQETDTQTETVFWSFYVERLSSQTTSAIRISRKLNFSELSVWRTLAKGLISRSVFSFNFMKLKRRKQKKKKN